MLLVTSNKSKQLLYIRYIGHVRLDEFQSAREDLTAQLGELSPGFHLLADFSQLESMGLDCTPELGRMMELIGQAGVGLVVRVIPDPSKDIGMNILTVFHYPHRLRVVTCQNLTDAARALGL
jgi:anti-anti-sigma regulatory factor